MNKNKLFLAVIIAAILFTAYFWYRYSSSLPPSPGTGETAPSEESSFKTTMQRLQRLKTLKLDTAMVRDPVFKMLEIPPAPPDAATTSAGRTNPFIPF